MRLLVVSQYFWPENFRINDLVEELVRRGHEVTVLTGLPNYPEGRIDPAFERNPGAFSEYRGARIVRVPLTPRGNTRKRLALNYASFMMSASLLGPPKIARREFDAVFVFEPSPVTVGVPAVVIGAVRDVPVVMWVLDLWPETLSAVGAVRSSLVLHMVGWLVSFIYRRCDRVLGQSLAFRESIARYAGDEERFGYFPNWAEPLFAGDLNAIEPAPEIPRNPGMFNVVFTGNIGEAQDFPAVLDAVHALRENDRIHWYIVGDGRNAEWVRAEITSRGIANRITLLGRHPLERMPAFLRGADALLVSLKRDPVFSLTIPGKVQTYLAAGLPIVAMLDGEGARVIHESGAGTVCPAGDGAALAREVIRLAAMSPAERAEMGVRGRGYCARHFDRDRLVTQLEEWLAESVRRRVTQKTTG